MFGFFRRQSKKNGDAAKSNAGKKAKTKSSLNIQCVPVDKYEIDFSRPAKEEEKIRQPEKTPRTENLNQSPYSIKRIMGNSESTSKKSNNVATGIGLNKTDSFNAYEGRVTETDVSTRWSNDYKTDRYKDEVNKNKHFDLLENAKTSESKRSENEPNFKSQPYAEAESHKREDEAKFCNVASDKTVDDTKSSTNTDIKYYNRITNKACSQRDLQCEKTDISAKCESELKKSEKLSANEDNVNRDHKINDGSLSGLHSVSTSPNGVMTNETSATKHARDEFTKQRQYSAEMWQEDSNNHEDGFDTAPSSPTTEATRINQNTRKFITPRERFLSFDTQPDADETFTQNLDQHAKNTYVKNTNEQTESLVDSVKQTNVQEENLRYDNNQKPPTNEISLLENADETKNEDGCEPNNSRVDQYSKTDDVEEGSSTQNQFSNKTEKNTLNASIKEEIQKLPQHVEQYINSKKSAKQIPDIMITESSDSENEYESEEDIESYPRYYDRVYPSVLYDITEVDEPFSDASDVEFNSFAEDDKRNIVHQESKFQDQIKSLKCDIETKDTENMQLRGKITDLQREITNKTWGMDRLHAELASFQTEAECVRKKLLKVEEDLNRYKAKNCELNEELLKKLEYESDYKKVSALQNEVDILKIRILEQQGELENVKKEKEELQKRLAALESEKNEKIKTLQMALDDTLKQKQKMQAQFEEEYEKLRTVNSDREQQLLNDFEWKLREVELTCKKKLEDKDKTNEDKLKQIKKQLEAEINELKKQIKELEKMKTYEAEVTQLRGLTHEQQRSLRMANRATEQLQTNERILNEEIERLRSSLEKERSHLATIQGIHSREIAEKDRKYSFKLEQQKNEINSGWEDKLRRETTRMKLEIEKAQKEEKRNLIEEAKIKAENQLKENNQIWEKKILDSKKQLEESQQKLKSAEENYRKELVRLQTNSDRDMLELRRKLDKMDLAYQEQLEKKQEQHEQEIETLRENCEKKLQQSEQNWSQQVSSTRATLELVKEQLQREAEDQLETLSKKYMLQIEEQYETLVKEKEEAIAQVREKYSAEMYDLQNQLNEELKAQKTRENELLSVINQLKEEISLKNQNEIELQSNVDSLHNTVSELQEKISTYNDNLSRETDALLRKKEVEHNIAMTELKERYENEIKQWQAKFSANTKEFKERSNELNNKAEECSNASNIDRDRQSRSSRRKGRGRHNKGQRNQQQQQYNHQFSSSSL